MRKTVCTRGLSALLLILSLLLVIPLEAGAAEDDSGFLVPVTDRTVSHYEALTVRLGRARLAMKGLYISGTPYLPLYELCDAFTECRMTQSGTNLRLTAEGMTANIVNGGYYVEVNGRYFYMTAPSVVMSDGALYVPMKSAAKTVGITAAFDVSSKTVTLSGSYRAPHSGDLVYSADSVYWLSRIISAESRGEPLLGQIAVGCVVRNRVASPAFPNSIWSVIFDRKDGVQFTPVANGTVYASPDPLSVIAAKICLEGYSLSPDVLFFYEPVASTSSWIENNRPYLFTVGHHRFFS